MKKQFTTPILMAFLIAVTLFTFFQVVKAQYQAEVLEVPVRFVVVNEDAFGAFTPISSETNLTDLNVTNDFRVQGDTTLTATTTVSDDFIVGAGKTLIVSTTTATTSPQLFLGAAAGVSTTTLEAGHAEGLDFCMQIYENGVATRAYINDTSWVIEAGLCT